jgi:hypothetical protein
MHCLLFELPPAPMHVDDLQALHLPENHPFAVSDPNDELTDDIIAARLSAKRGRPVLDPNHVDDFGMYNLNRRHVQEALMHEEQSKGRSRPHRGARTSSE